MLGRCFNPKATGWKCYGGRGITTCERWRTSFENFLADVGPRPSPGHSLDRIDNSGHYEPGNVRWATWKMQGRNRRDNRLLTHDGVTLSLAEWSERCGLRKSTLTYRLANGWPMGKALTAPPMERSERARGRRTPVRAVSA